MKHLIETTDWSEAEVQETLRLAAQLKKEKKGRADFIGKSMVLLFFNPSLRTRVSFIRAMEQLGGSALAMDVGRDAWKLVTGEGVAMDGDGVEHIKEGVPVLGRYCDFVGIRAFGDMKSYENDRKDDLIRSASRVSTVPLVNMESAMAHPCQAFADALTVQETGRKNPNVVLSWVPHPKAVPMAVSNSFILMAARMGWKVTLLRPERFPLDPEVMWKAAELSRAAGGSFRETDDRNAAYEGADVVYAKSWGSAEGYGNPDFEKEKKKGLDDWRVDGTKMKRTNDAIFLHCLPVRRNVEVTDEILDSPSSKVIDQAENRLHAQKAVLLTMAEGK
ncbi:MAG: N-acetylornithine carbamoyltransferase [Pseudomonadota bacterium]